jgi:hypothetical protein
MYIVQVECPLCDQAAGDCATEKGRVSHLRACGRARNVAPQHLIEMLRAWRAAVEAIAKYHGVTCVYRKACVISSTHPFSPRSLKLKTFVCPPLASLVTLSRQRQHQNKHRIAQVRKPFASLLSGRLCSHSLSNFLDSLTLRHNTAQ